MWKRLGLVGVMLVVLGGGLMLTDRPVLGESAPAAQKTKPGTIAKPSTNRSRHRHRRTHSRRRRRGRH